MSTSKNTQATATAVKHPNNLSDYAMVYGGQVAGTLAMVLTWDDGLLQAFVAGCQGMVMGTILLAVGLTLIGQAPAVFKRIRNGEPLDCE
jgi:hypothetical protein